MKRQLSITAIILFCFILLSVYNGIKLFSHGNIEKGTVSVLIGFLFLVVFIKSNFIK